METIESLREAWRERWRREAAAAEERAGRARRLLPELCRILVEDYGATRVALIGSLARRDFGSRSDIDLVVSGVPPRRFFHAAGALDRVAGEFEVDLVPWEKATDDLLADLEREGEILHDEG